MGHMYSRTCASEQVAAQAGDLGVKPKGVHTSDSSGQDMSFSHM